MSILVISCSGNPGSRSRLLAKAAHAELEREGEKSTFLDIRDLELPPCDGASTYGHPNVIEINRLVEEAEGLIFATPIYNYAANSITKNVIEHAGRAMENKVVAFLCAAGGAASYMAIMSLANSLMLDFRCLIVPRFVYAHGKETFTADAIASPEIQTRVADLAREMRRLVKAHRS